MLKEFILSTIISTSLNLETSNDETASNDYEFMMKAEKNGNNFSYFIMTDWERELGKKYRDNVFKLKYISLDNIYYGFDMISKETKNIDYLSINSGYSFSKIGLQTGLSAKYSDATKTDILVHLSYNNIFKKNNTDYTVYVSLKSDFKSNKILELNSDIKTWLTDRINLFFLGKSIRYSNKEDVQFKIGLGFKL